jgi:hypothetical protein
MQFTINVINIGDTKFLICGMKAKVKHSLILLSTIEIMENELNTGCHQCLFHPRMFPLQQPTRSCSPFTTKPL